MMQIVQQRKYIQDFCDFTSSFAITENVTVSEMEIVEANLKILLDRINNLKHETFIGLGLSRDKLGTCGCN